MSEKEKSAGQLLKEKLFRSPKNAGSTLSEEEIKAAFDYCEPYKEFISTCIDTDISTAFKEINSKGIIRKACIDIFKKAIGLRYIYSHNL